MGKETLTLEFRDVVADYPHSEWPEGLEIVWAEVAFLAESWDTATLATHIGVSVETLEGNPEVAQVLSAVRHPAYAAIVAALDLARETSGDASEAYAVIAQAAGTSAEMVRYMDSLQVDV